MTGDNTEREVTPEDIVLMERFGDALEIVGNFRGFEFDPISIDAVTSEGRPVQFQIPSNLVVKIFEDLVQEAIAMHNATLSRLQESVTDSSGENTERDQGGVLQ